MINTSNVMVVRIYITESSQQLNDIVTYLKKEAKIRGVTVFRAISGFGTTGTHSSSWLDLSLDLPLVIEFFDQEDKIQIALAHLNQTIKHEHMLFWHAQENC